MTAIDWKMLAPKRADWERLSAAFKADGLPHCRWLNGIPEFDGKVDMARVQEIVEGKAMPRPAPLPKISPDEQPVKRGRGRPRKK